MIDMRQHRELPQTWEWWEFPCPYDPAGWYVRIDLDTHHWLVAYLGKVVISEVLL